MPATDWREKVASNWINTRLGHEGLMMDKIQKEGALVRRLVRKTQNGTVGQATDEPEDAEEADPVGVMIGNEIHYHGPQPKILSDAETPGGGAGTANGAAPAGSPQAPDTPLWKKAATLAAVMAGCGSLPLAGIGAHSLLSSPETPAVKAQEITLPGYGVEVEKAPKEATP